MYFYFTFRSRPLTLDRDRIGADLHAFEAYSLKFGVHVKILSFTELFLPSLYEECAMHICKSITFFSG